MAANSLYRLMVVALLSLISAALHGAQSARGADSLDQFEANEVINSLKIELFVSAKGENLDEPIALDLGLGFPFWLHKLGRVESSYAPFGAVCQIGSETHDIRAGEHASFEFLRAADSGLDLFLTTPQLISELHASDIARIAFCSKADHGWIIEGYTLTINGKVFASNKKLDANGRVLQDAAREHLGEIENNLSTNEQELSDLSGLVATQLASEEEAQRFRKLSSETALRLAEQRKLQRQLQGASPFWHDESFRSPWRGANFIQQVRVSLVTAPHSEAESNNYVYFGIGGHNYLLGSPTAPLSPDLGTQEFDLDLETAPLIASDFRGLSLGMLAHPESVSDVADRWHPQRLRVTMDERVIYDSEDLTLDRLSLSAIRLIPPAITNFENQVVAVQPTSRELSVWTPGSGAGLDLIHGGAAQLPDEQDPNYPQAESSVRETQAEQIDQFQGDSLTFDSTTQVPPAQEVWYDSFAGPFPGEYSFAPNWQPRFRHPVRRLIAELLGLSSEGAGWLTSWGNGFDPGWGQDGVTVRGGTQIGTRTQAYCSNCCPA